MNTFAASQKMGWANYARLEGVKRLRLEFIVDGKTAMSTEHGICKGTEWLWYDDRSLLCFRASGPGKFCIVLSHISGKGGGVDETLENVCAGAGGLRHGA